MQFGCLLATTVLEVSGPQEYRLDAESLAQRLADTYGDTAAAEITPHLSAIPMITGTFSPHSAGNADDHGDRG
jgi:adenosine kinase